MAPIEEPTDRPTAYEQSVIALNSSRESANGSLDGASGQFDAEEQASSHSGSRSDEQTIEDEQQPTIKIETADFCPFSSDTVHQGRDAYLELNENIIDPAACDLDFASRARLCDDWRKAPTHIEEFRQFVERMKGKLLKSMEVFQLLCPNTEGVCSQDAALCSATDSFTLDHSDSLDGPVLSSTLRHSTSVLECNPVTGAQFPSASDSRQSSSSTSHGPLLSRPPNVFPFTSSPFVSSSSGNSGFFDAVRVSNKEYENLLDETLRFVEQVFLKLRKKLETCQPGTDVSVHGTGQATGIEDTGEGISLQKTEKYLMNVIQNLEKQLQCKNFQLQRLEKENDSLTEQVEKLSSYWNEQREESRVQINSLMKKLNVKGEELDRADQSLANEQQKAETFFSDLMETKRALEDNRNLTLSYTNKIADQSESIKYQKILLDQCKERISQLQSDLATAKLNRKAAEQELETEMKNHSTLRREFEQNSKLLRKAKQYFETIGIFLLKSAGDPADDDRSQGSALPLVQNAGTPSNSFDGLSKNIFCTLKKIFQELEISRAASKLTNTIQSNEFVKFIELQETVREAMSQRDNQKERLTNLKHSILDSISTIKKLEPQRKNEVKSLINLLKWVSCDRNDLDASDENSKVTDFLKQNHDMRTELEDLLRKSLMIECLIGSPTPDESVNANNSALSGRSFREEQESVFDTSEQSSVAQANDPESLEALDKTLCSTLNNLVQLKLADRARKSAHIVTENARTDELEKVKEELEMTIQTITRDNCEQVETLQKQSEESECELIATKERLAALSLQIGITVGETVELSEMIENFEFASDSPSDEGYVMKYLSPLRLLCRDVLKTDGSGTIQLCNLLRCCFSAIKEYGKIREELTSAKKEIEIDRQQTRDLARCKQTDLEWYRKKTNQTSHTLAQLTRETLACAAKLRAAGPWSGCLDFSAATVSQTSGASNNFEENLSWLSNSVASLTATVDGSIKDMSTLNEQKTEMGKAYDCLLAVVRRVKAEVKGLEEELKHLEDERRRLCKQLKDCQSLVQGLQERLDRWENFMEREEPIMSRNLEELSVLEAGITEARAARALAGEMEPTRASILGSQESRDSTLPDQSRSTDADSRRNSHADAGRSPPMPHLSYTRKRIAAVKEGTTACTDGAAQARQVPLPLQSTCNSRVLPSQQTPPHRNTVASPVTKIKLSESLHRQLAEAPGSSKPHQASTPPTTSTSRGVLPGPRVTTGRGSRLRADSPCPPSLLPLRADDGGCPRDPDRCEVLPYTDGWRRSIVVGCISSIVVWYIYSKHFLQ